MKKFLVSTIFCALAASGATLTHDYNLTGSLNDLVGSTPLISDGGTVGGTGYTFTANQGLHVSSVLASVLDYSILTDFSFQTVIGFLKIVDLKDRSSDNGLYNLGGALNFYNVVTGAGTPFTANTQARVVITRDFSTQTLTGYFNGISQFSFNDSGSIGTFTGASGIIRFFEDDFATSQREASGGLATRISLYDGALSAAQVAALSGPSLPAAPGVPEPSSFVLLGSALMAVGFAARRR